ncbi:hypothetical protein L210DRAFT_931022 [Boletus edulis BED1]|uniref:Uncharacterized protein n=1 Tax=Boletus edulis BED1 TaxID=1328754 RepID=A0AAD4BH48_BOLED|nr:hypothetical protein L210DRAFT_931022 [Boletus edulis BED1]
MVNKKTKEKGGGKETKNKGTSNTTKNTKVADTLLLDQGVGGGGSGQLEDSVKHKRGLENKAHKALIGYAYLDLIDNKQEIRFGAWNDWPLQKEQVNRLVQSFLTKGADRFAYTKAIPLVVAKKDLKEGTYTADYRPGSVEPCEIPKLELKAETKGKRRLAAAGGQHRLHAVEAWTKILQKQHADLTKLRQHLEQQDSEAVTTMEISEENLTRKPKRESLQETLALGGLWMVILYDSDRTSLLNRISLDKVTQEIGLHLSQNESDHVYRETPEEGLVHLFRTMKEGKKTHRDVDQKEGVTGSPRKWAELLSQDYFWEFMERVQPMGIHMFDGKSNMKLHRLHQTMFGPLGGILSYMVSQMEDYVCECFNDVPVDEDKVDSLIAQGSVADSDDAKVARNELRAIYAQMKAARSTMKGAKGAVYAIRECFDDAFVQHLGGLSHVDELFANQKSHRWRVAMNDYTQEIITELPNVIATISMTEVPEDSDEHQVLRCLKWAVAKVKVWRFLLIRTKPEKSYCLVPLMSRCVFDHMVKHLSVISDALHEFCRWWEPLIDMVPVIGKYWTPGSPSAAMVRAILCHRDIDDNHREICVRHIIYVVWNDYASFVNMQLQLHDRSIPTPITVQKKLLSIFGVDSEGRNTKELRLARVYTTPGVTTKKTTTTTKGKGKGKNADKKNMGGKGKKHKPDDDASDDEGDDDNDTGDGDGELVKGLDSAWGDSDEVGEEGDEEEDDEVREKRDRVRQENVRRQQRALAANNQEWSEIHTMLTGSKGDGRHKTAPVLNFDRSPPSFLVPWKKLSRVSKDRNASPIRGLSLIDWTIWEWKDITTQSFSRVMHTLAAAAIAESARIISYRPEMIHCHPIGSAATVRLQAQAAVESFLTTLKDLLGSASQGSKEGQGAVLMEGSLPPAGCVTWADGIYPTAPQRGVAIHVVEDELMQLDREKALGAQQRGVQKAVDVIQNLRVSWHDPTSRVNPREQPPLDADVANALHALVTALNTNAYRQRVKETHTLAFDPNEALQPRERLRIVIRADIASDEDVSDEFVMRAQKALHVDNVPTKAQSIWHLEEMEKKYSVWLEAKRKQAETVPFKFEPGDRTDDHSLAEDEDEDEDNEDVTDNEGECDAEGSVGEQPPPSEAMDDEVTESQNNVDISASMYEDLPCNSDGEFISTTQDTVKGKYIFFYIDIISPFSTVQMTWHRAFQDPHGMRVLVPTTPPEDDTRHVLDGVAEVKEGHDGDSNIVTEQDPIKYFTTLRDDDNNDNNDNNNTTASSPPVVLRKHVTSPQRTQVVRNSLKRDRALTVSSTGSKDERSEYHNSKPVKQPKHVPKRTKHTVSSTIDPPPIATSSSTGISSNVASGSSSKPRPKPRLVKSNTSKPTALDEISYQA